MSEAVPLPAPPAGRTLWQDARIRLLRNRAAVASLVVLALMTLICIFGPWFTDDPYDRVYQDYVRVPASLSAYPKAEALPAAVQRIGLEWAFRLVQEPRRLFRRYCVGAFGFAHTVMLMRRAAMRSSSAPAPAPMHKEL